MINYGSSGVGSGLHLAMEMLKWQAGIDIVHVAYRGLAPLMTAVTAGEVQAAVVGFGTARSLIEAGRLRVLAAAAPNRIAALPDVPTTRESAMTAWMPPRGSPSPHRRGPRPKGSTASTMPFRARSTA